jgi:hypothetical protein
VFKSSDQKTAGHGRRKGRHCKMKIEKCKVQISRMGGSEKVERKKPGKQGTQAEKPGNYGTFLHEACVPLGTQGTREASQCENTWRSWRSWRPCKNPRGIWRFSRPPNTARWRPWGRQSRAGKLGERRRFTSAAGRRLLHLLSSVGFVATRTGSALQSLWGRLTSQSCFAPGRRGKICPRNPSELSLDERF